jgi:hypothetical protein
MFTRVSRFNIFILGFLIVLGAFAYWVVPNMLGYLGRVGMDTLVQYKWFFAVLGGVLTLLVAWIIYLRYKLASQSIEAQAELDRYRLQLELAPESAAPLQIGHTKDGVSDGADSTSIPGAIHVSPPPMESSSPKGSTHADTVSSSPWQD